MKYQVKRWHGVAHMIDPLSGGRKTFCGKQTNDPSWTIDEGATLVEFIEVVRPRCSGCLKNCEVVNNMNKLMGETD